MTAGFSVQRAGTVRGDATLGLVGIDAEDPGKQPIIIALNGVAIYEGLDPLPNDFCCGPSGAGNWGSAEILFPGSLLQSSNTLSVTNLDPSDCTFCPTFVMIDSAQVTYVARDRP